MKHLNLSAKKFGMKFTFLIEYEFLNEFYHAPLAI